MDLYALTSQEVLDRISRHCPGAMSVYLICINHTRTNGAFFFSKLYIEQSLSLTVTLFRNSLRKLSAENLLEWHPINKGFSITMVDIDDE